MGVLRRKNSTLFIENKKKPFKFPKKTVIVFENFSEISNILVQYVKNL